MGDTPGAGAAVDPLPAPAVAAAAAVQAGAPAVGSASDGGAAAPAHTYTIGTVTVDGEQLATYVWLPAATAGGGGGGDGKGAVPPPRPRGVVYLLHGFRSHARFNFLRSEPPATLWRYDGSFVAALVGAGLAVVAHDHVGHGASSGLRTYFSSFDDLVAGSLAVVDTEAARHGLADLPAFLVGHSMGGTVALLTALARPAAFVGLALSSAATEPPASSFGLKGRLLQSLSALLSALTPTLEVLTLPTNTVQPELHALFLHDKLNSEVQLRARVGAEFLRAYARVGAAAADVRVPLLAMAGEHDTLVHPQAAQRFAAAVGSPDVTVRVWGGRWHNLLVETGREEVWATIREWVMARV